MKLNIGVLIVLIGSFLSFGARAEPPPGIPPAGNPLAALQELVEELAASQQVLQGRVGDLETSVAGLEASVVQAGTGRIERPGDVGRPAAAVTRPSSSPAPTSRSSTAPG